MKNTPNHEIVMIPNGKHPCYLDDPELWHKSIINFINACLIFTLDASEFHGVVASTMVSHVKGP